VVSLGADESAGRVEISQTSIDFATSCLEQDQEREAVADAQCLQIERVDPVDRFPDRKGEPLQGRQSDPHAGKTPRSGRDSQQVELVDLDPGQTQ
jgi:hypothetical protein